MSKLIDKEQLAKLAQGLDQRMKDAVAAEKTRAEAAEGAVDTKADANAQAIEAINAEETGILAQAKAHAQGLVDGEKQRAEAEEADIRADFAAADDALKAALQAEIDADVKVEKERAEGVEAAIRQELADAIAQEVIDRNAAIKVEEDRAKAAEEAEATARAAADTALDNRLQIVEAFFGQEEEGGEVLNLSSVNAAIKAADDKAVAAQEDVDALEIVVEELDTRVETAEGEIDTLQAFVEGHSHEEMEQGIADNAAAIAKEVEDRESAIEGVQGEVEAEAARAVAEEGKIRSEFAAADAQVLVDAKAYADQEITKLVDSAPDAMNTLNELAEAINTNKDVYDAYVEQHATAMANMKSELQAEIDADVKVVADELAKQKDAAQEGTLAHQIAAEKTRAEGVEAGLEARIDTVEAFVEGHSHDALQGEIDAIEQRLDNEGGLVDRIEAVEGFVSGHSHEGLQDEIDAVELRVDALEAFKNGHDHSVMEQGIADNKAAIEKEVEDRDAAIAAALEAYSTTEEMKAILGSVVNSLALTMEDNKMVLRLGGVEGIAITETSLDMATDDDINAILAGLDEEE